ncbi:MAG TPA: hypothetical protein VIE65_12285 [Methylobacter sp.]|jgi:hypothetical protein
MSNIEKIAFRVAKIRLPLAAEGEKQESLSYGGKGPFSLPPDHIAAMEVPKGGACCDKCSFVDREAHACKQPNYIEWNGGDPALPDLPLDQICSDWFTVGTATTETAETTED